MCVAHGHFGRPGVAENVPEGQEGHTWQSTQVEYIVIFDRRHKEYTVIGALVSPTSKLLIPKTSTLPGTVSGMRETDGFGDTVLLGCPNCNKGIQIGFTLCPACRAVSLQGHNNRQTVFSSGEYVLGV